jgi:hypothetical protein
MLIIGVINSALRRTTKWPGRNAWLCEPGRPMAMDIVKGVRMADILPMSSKDLAGRPSVENLVRSWHASLDLRVQAG